MWPEFSNAMLYGFVRLIISILTKSIFHSLKNSIKPVLHIPKVTEEVYSVSWNASTIQFFFCFHQVLSILQGGISLLWIWMTYVKLHNSLTLLIEWITFKFIFLGYRQDSGWQFQSFLLNLKGEKKIRTIFLFLC